MQLPALDEGLALTPCCLAAASQDRLILASADGEGPPLSHYATASKCEDT